jgi:hypothetical protein
MTGKPPKKVLIDSWEEVPHVAAEADEQAWWATHDFSDRLLAEAVRNEHERCARGSDSERPADILSKAHQAGAEGKRRSGSLAPADGETISSRSRSRCAASRAAAQPASCSHNAATSARSRAFSARLPAFDAASRPPSRQRADSRPAAGRVRVVTIILDEQWIARHRCTSKAREKAVTGTGSARIYGKETAAALWRVVTSGGHCRMKVQAERPGTIGAVAMEARVYDLSNLQQQGKAMLDAARHGKARIRGADGQTFQLLPERRAQALEHIAQAMANLVPILQPLQPRILDCPPAYGEWAWLESLDADDLCEFVEEMLGALVVTAREESAAELEQTLSEWRTTAQQLADPMRRSILLSPQPASEFFEVGRPESSGRTGA